VKNSARIIDSILVLLASAFVIFFVVAPQSFAISINQSSPQPYGSTIQVGGCAARDNTFDSIYLYAPSSAGEGNYDTENCSTSIGSDPVSFDYHKYSNAGQSVYGPGTYTFVELNNNTCADHSTLTAARSCSEYVGETSFTFSTPTCSVTVSPDRVDLSSTNDTNFHITNSGETPFEWIKISRPSENFKIEGVGGEGSEFITGIEIPANTSYDQLLSVTSGADAAASSNWTVLAADNPNGDNATTCVGNLGTAITVHPNPLTISNVTITNNSTTSEIIAWNTSVAADSYVYYGPTSDYGSVGSDTNLSTSHSITLTDLSEDTTYKFYVQDTDGSSNTVRSTETAFTTSSAPTTTTTVTVTNTVTTVITPAPAPTSVPDTIPPTVYLTTDFTKPFLKAPEIFGKASDNKNVASINYSIDNGKNWLPVDAIISPGAKSTNFSFTPAIFEDGNYNLKIRAKDSAGNIGTSNIYILIIDRLPPQLGAVLFSIGPQLLVPDKDGVIFTFPNMQQKITLSAVGGPTSVDIVTDNQSSKIGSQSSVLNSQTYSLIKNIDNGLWSGTLSFSKAGTYQLMAKAIDGAKNKTERKLNTVVVLNNGKVLSDDSPITSGSIALWYFDNQTQRFVLWDGKSYGQANPEGITKDGEYGFLAPAGTYYLEAKSFGFKTLRSEIFTLSDTTPILTNLKMKKSLSINLGPLVIPLPDFSVSKQSIDTMSPIVSSQVKIINDIIGSEAPLVDLFLGNQAISTFSFVGKPTIFTFFSTWSPYASQQLKFLGDLSFGNSQINVVPVVSQETATSVTVFSKRGEYSFPIYSDPDGLLVKPFNLSFLPTSIFVDRKGIIQKVNVGTLTADELLENVVN